MAEAAPKPLVMGRHLIALGLEPGIHFKELLGACFEAQLDGEFSDLEGALVYARDVVESYVGNQPQGK